MFREGGQNGGQAPYSRVALGDTWNAPMMAQMAPMIRT